VTNQSTSNLVIAGVNIAAGATAVLNFAQSNWPSWGYDGITGRNETMTDEHGIIGGYNPCNHVKEVFDYPVQNGASMTLNLVKSGQKYSVTYLPGGESCSAAIRDVPNFSTSYPAIASVDALKAQAIGSMRPGEPPTGVDLLQFLGELTDFSDLLESTARKISHAGVEIEKFLLTKPGSKLMFGGELFHAILDDGRAMKERVKYAFSLSLADWALLGANWHLAMKLLWDPLIQDLKKIKRAVYNLDRAYMRIKNPKPQVVKGRASSKANAPNVTGGRTAAGHYVISQRQRTREVVVWAQVLCEPVGVIPFTFLWHYLGLYPRTSVAWELTPLSFVVDMVIDIGSYLRQFELAPIQLQFKTIKSGCSVKNTDTHTDQLYWSFNNNTDLTGPAHVRGSTGTYTSSQYIRTPGPIAWDAGSATPVQIGVPSFGQWGTILELIFSMWGRS
jgi:hypothetical protein